MIRLDCPHNFKVPFTVLLTKHVLMSFLLATFHHLTIMFDIIIWLSNSNSNQVIEESGSPFAAVKKADERTIQHAVNLNLGKQVCHSGNCRLQWGNCLSHWSCKIQQCQPFLHGILSETIWYFPELWMSRVRSKKRHSFLPCVRSIDMDSSFYKISKKKYEFYAIIKDVDLCLCSLQSYKGYAKTENAHLHPNCEFQNASSIFCCHSSAHVESIYSGRLTC